MEKQMKTAVHITHESMKKIGGIGTVLNGVCTTKAYKNFFDRTVFYGPLFGTSIDVLVDLEKTGEVLFSSADGHDKGNYGELFNGIRQKYGIDIIYGRRRLVDEFDEVKKNVADVFLIGTSAMNQVEVSKFKFILWEKFGIQSDLYPNDCDYEQYLRIAIPFLEILNKVYGTKVDYYYFAHEYMGIPSALSAISQKKHKTIFVAHEVSTARFLVENCPGHDISFYNILHNEQGKKSLEEVFGSQKQNPRNELVKLTPNFERIFAVSDLTKEEYLFLVPDTPLKKIKAVYNGLSVQKISVEQKRQSRKKIQEYIHTLLDFKPDVILTHVTRLVMSKGLWRDISLLYYLDEIFQSQNLKGAYILLSTFIATGRPSEYILRMEKDYGWPINHRKGWPDLMGMEAEIYSYLQIFNQKSKAIKGIFINQFGFNREKCGLRVPEDAQFIDLRIASDAEFGFSIYEPFGIAQLETVPFGGIAVLSSSCGSASFLKKTFKDAKIKPYYVMDFIGAGAQIKREKLNKLTIEKRTVIERELFAKHAKSIFETLPITETQKAKYLENAILHNSRLSWENIVQNNLLPNLPT